MGAFARDIAQYHQLNADEERALTTKIVRLRTHAEARAILASERALSTGEDFVAKVKFVISDDTDDDDEAVAAELGITVSALRAERVAALAARDALVAANMRLVVKIARDVRRNRGAGPPLLDLIQEGVLGLLHSMDTFDPSRGVKFTTYAYRMVVRRCQRAIAMQSFAVRVPERLVAASARLRAARATHFTETGEWPSRSQLATMLPDVSIPRLREAEPHIRGSIPLDTPLLPGAKTDTSGRTLTVADTVADHESRGPDSAVELRLACESVREAIRKCLKPRDARIMILKYGLDGEEPLLSKTIAKIFEVSETRIHQIVTASHDKIRNQEPDLALYV